MTLDKVTALKRTKLFAELNDSTLRMLADRAIERTFQKDEVLFIAGDDVTGMYVIVQGSVRAFRVGLDGREQVIHVERAGATIAELPVFDEGTYPSTAAAEELTTALFIDKRAVRSLCMEHPEISLAAIKVLAGRLRRCAELVEALSLREVGQRFAGARARLNQQVLALLDRLDDGLRHLLLARAGDAAGDRADRGRQEFTSVRHEDDRIVPVRHHRGPLLLTNDGRPGRDAQV